MEPAETTTDKQMLLSYAGTCRLCGAELHARQEAIYERASRSVRCMECSTAAVTRAAASEPEIQPGRRLSRVEWPAPRPSESTSDARESAKSGSGRIIRRSAA